MMLCCMLGNVSCATSVSDESRDVLDPKPGLQRRFHLADVAVCCLHRRLSLRFQIRCLQVVLRNSYGLAAHQRVSQVGSLLYVLEVDVRRHHETCTGVSERQATGQFFLMHALSTDILELTELALLSLKSLSPVSLAVSSASSTVSSSPRFVNLWRDSSVLMHHLLANSVHRRHDDAQLPIASLKIQPLLMVSSSSILSCFSPCRQCP